MTWKTRYFNFFFAPIISMTFLMPLFAIASSGTVTVLPAKTDISAKPGDRVKKELMLINTSSNPVVLKVEIKDFRAGKENGSIDVYEANTEQRAQKWLFPQYDIVSVAPFGSQKMEFIAALPENMPGRGYDGAIMFRLYDPSKKSAAQNTFGALVALNVAANGLTRGGSLARFSAPVLQFQSPSKFNVTIKNSGNSNASLGAELSLADIFGKPVLQSKLENLDVYPQSSKRFDLTLNNSALTGIYKAKIAISNPDAKNQGIETSYAWFMFVPWQKIVLSLIIFAGVVSVLTLLSLLAAKIRLRRRGEWAA